MRRAFLGLLLACAAGADEVGDAADRVAAAAAAGGGSGTAVVAVAAAASPDPWLVADELCRRGAHDAAAALAGAAARPDLAALVGYVARRRREPDDPAARAALARAEAEPDPAGVLDALAAVTDLRDDVPSVRIAGRRALARHDRDGPAAALPLLVDAADRAGRIGWHYREAHILRRAIGAAEAAGDLRAEMALRERLLALARRRECRADEALSVLDLARRHTDRRAPEKAAALLARARDLFGALTPRDLEVARVTDPQVAEARALTGFYEAQVRWQEGDEAKGVELCRAAVAALDAAGSPARAAFAQGTLGCRLSERGRYREAASELEAALERFRKLGNEQGASWVSGEIAWTCVNLGRYEEALRHYQSVLDVAERMSAPYYVAFALRGIGTVRERQGRYPEALEATGRALEISRRIGNPRAIADSLLDKGVVHWRLAQWAEAIACFEESGALNEEAGHVRGLSAALTNLGLVHQSIGEFKEALACQQRALGLLEAGPDRNGATRARGNLAISLEALGRNAEALALLDRALADARAMGDRPLEAAILGNLATVKAGLLDHRSALDLQRQAMALKEALGDRAGVAATRMNIGLACGRLGEFAQAEQALFAAREQFRDLGDLSGEARVLLRLGLVARDRDDAEAARRCYVEARDLFARAGVRNDLAWCDYNLAELSLLEGNAARSAEEGERALALAEQLGDGPLEVLCLGGLAVARCEVGDHAGAIAAARKGLDRLPTLVAGLAADEGAGARDRYRDVYIGGAAAALHLGDVDSFVHFVESGRAGMLLEALHGREALRDLVVPDALRRVEASARRAEASAHASCQRAIAEGDLATIRARREELEAARDRVREVIRRIRHETGARAGLVYPEPAPLERMRGWVREGEALVLYAFLTGKVAALVLTRDEARIVPLEGVEAIEAACAALRPERLDVDPAAAVERLRALAVEPLALPEKATRILVSPDGALTSVPFLLLLPGRDVAYAPSGTSWGGLLAEGGGRGRGVLALGDPEYGAGAAVQQRGALGRLPATRAEAEAVGDDVLLGAAASESGLLAALSRRERWRAVHLACHGLIDTEVPHRSSLALAADESNDGLLSLLDVYRLHVPADLVVLSACETARGKVYYAQGVIGFTRAFMFAGAPRVVVSLWKVDDEATRALMERFYARWNPKDRAAALPAAAALRLAQEEVAAQERWRHPFYWAAWQLWGLPD